MPINAEQVMWGALGAGSKGVVSGLASGVMPEASLPANVVSAGTGFAMANWGGQRVGDMGIGLLLASIGDMIDEPLKKFFGGFMQGNNAKAKASNNPSSNPSGENIDAYARARYGV